jgi:hypothetical protein
MIIKISGKRKEFERILKQIGYKDQSPILKVEKLEYPVLKELSGNCYEIFYFTKAYFNKKTYLYEFFLNNYNKLNKKEIKKELKILCKDIIYKEKTRICEIGWGINNSNMLYFSTKEHLKKIYFGIIKIAKIICKNGNNILIPQKGDILVSKPEGGKILGSSNHERYLIAQKQRSNINKKFGFGDMKGQGSQYARYDEDLILKPI